MNLLTSVLRSVDWLVERTGWLVASLTVVLMLTMTYEVIARYVFNHPTFWSYDTTYMMGAVLWVFAGSYELLRRGHVRVDLFYERYSPRKKLITDLVLTPPLLFTALSVMIYQAWKLALHGLAVGELSLGGIWQPSVVPLRFAVAVGFSLLGLAAVGWFLRDLLSLITGKKEIGGKSHD